MKASEAVAWLFLLILLLLAAASLHAVRYMAKRLYALLWRSAPTEQAWKGEPDPRRFVWTRSMQDYMNLLGGAASIVVHWEDTEPTRYEIVGRYMFNLITVRGDSNMQFHVDLDCCDPASVRRIGSEGKDLWFEEFEEEVRRSSAENQAG